MDFVQYGLTEHDLAFLKEKLDNDELVTAHGSLTATGELCSYTPATGYTFYHLSSELTVVGAASALTYEAWNLAVSIKNDGVIKDIIGGSHADADFADNARYGMTGGKPTRNKSTIPQKLIGNSSKKFSMNVDTYTTGSNITVYGTLIGYIEAS